MFYEHFSTSGVCYGKVSIRCDFFRAAAKNRYTWSVWGRKQVHYKIKSKVHPTSPAIGPKRIVPVFGRIKPRCTRVCLLCLTFNCICRFIANQRPSIVPPYVPHTNADGRGDPLHPSHPTPRHTSNTRTCLHTSAEIHTAYGYQSAP